MVHTDSNITCSVFDNVTTAGELKEELTKAFKDLDAILFDHAGPFASDCVIGSRWRQVNDVDEFTKDGIKILRHLIVSDDVSARFAARLARFIGIAVDKRCHDGTTTSMLLFCRLAIVAMSKMDSDRFSRDRYLWTKEFFDLLDVCLSALEELKITEEDILARCEEFGIKTTDADVRSSMAYHMAMVSSKGDHDLSSKVAAIIRSSPKKIYGMFKDTPLAVETQERYVLKKQEHDLALNANLGHVHHYNYKSNTQYLSEDAVIFFSGNDIVMNSNESLFLKAFISESAQHRADLNEFGVGEGWEKHHNDRRNLIIMAPMIDDPTLIDVINRFNHAHPHFRISWFNIHIHPRLRSSLDKTIHYMTGTHLFQDVTHKDAGASLIGLNDESPIRVHLIGHVVTITNLYEKTGEVFHPLYSDPECFEPYTRFRQETEDLIEFANENISNPALDHDELTYLTSLYRALTCQEIYDIEVGGSAHDQYANRTVYEDAIGAALSAVNEGVILGGYGHLHRMMMNLAGHNIIIVKEFADQFASIVYDSLRSTDREEVKQLMRNGLHDKWSYIVADPLVYRTEPNSSAYISAQSLDKDALMLFLENKRGTPILLQAFGGYQEQFSRFRDILPRLSNTSNVADMRMKEGEDVR